MAIKSTDSILEASKALIRLGAPGSVVHAWVCNVGSHCAAERNTATAGDLIAEAVRATKIDLQMLEQLQADWERAAKAESTTKLVKLVGAVKQLPFVQDCIVSCVESSWPGEAIGTDEITSTATSGGHLAVTVVVRPPKELDVIATCEADKFMLDLNGACNDETHRTFNWVGLATAANARSGAHRFDDTVTGLDQILRAALVAYELRMAEAAEAHRRAFASTFALSGLVAAALK
jgi:hypothetical protein